MEKIIAETTESLSHPLSPKQLGRRALAAFSRYMTERRQYKDTVRRQRTYYYERGIPQLSTFAGPLIDEFYRPDAEPSPPPIVSEREAMAADIEAANQRLEVARSNHSGV